MPVDIERIKRSAIRKGIWDELKSQLLMAESSLNRARDIEMVKSFAVNISQVRIQLELAEQLYAEYISLNQ